MNEPHFVYPCIVDGHSGCFHLSVIMNIDFLFCVARKLEHLFMFPEVLHFLFHGLPVQVPSLFSVLMFNFSTWTHQHSLAFSDRIPLI